MRLLIILTLFIGFGAQAQSQHWATVKTDKDANFFEKQAAFEAYWEGKEYEKGKGYKQFKRWEWFWEQRVGPSGEFPDPQHMLVEYERFFGSEETKSLTKSNANWTSLGPTSLTQVAGSPGIGRVSAIARDPQNTNVLYVGTPAGGLWKSTDNGTSWTPMTDHLPTLGVSGIVVDHNNTDIIYIATGDGDADDTYSIGVLKSTDGGVNWENTGLVWQIEDLRVCNHMIMSPDDSQTIYVATDVGLWKTTNGGQDWNGVLGGEIDDIVFKPGDPETIYAVGNTFNRSTNGGQTFEVITDGMPSSSDVVRYCVAVSADEPDWVYVLAGDSDEYGFEGLYRSTNSGESFTQRSNSPNIMGWSGQGSDEGGQAWYDIALEVNPTNANQVFTGGVNLWRSNNGGANWSIEAHWVYPSFTNAYVHADIHGLEYIGSDLYCVSDGGVYRSNNNGTTFTDLTPGIANSQLYRLGASATNEDLILTGAQDNGIIRKLGNNWGQIYGADGMECLVHPTNENRYFISSQYGGIRRTNNGGASFDNWVNGINETGAWLTPYMLDPNDPSTLFVGFESIWKRTGTQNWIQVSPSLSNITEFKIAPSNSDVIYVARGPSMSRTLDGGDTWENVSIGASAFARTYFAFDPEDENIVYVTLSGFSDGEKIYRTLDGGETWENFSMNLPNFPANTVVVDNEGNGGVYVGMDIGVYYTNNDLASWIPFNEGLANAPVSELEIHEASGKLRAATYGRGAWESPLFGGIQQAPVADFASTDVVICAGEEITYSDESIYHGPGWDWAFEGGTPATSTEAEPTIVYNTEGVFESSLTVTNSFGDDTETKAEYINVLSGVGEEYPFSEGFESITDIAESDRWFIENENNDVTWASRTDLGYESTSCIWFNNEQNTLDHIDRLYSTTLDLSGVESVVLTMDVAFAQKDEDDQDRLRVYVSDNCGANWSLKKTFSGHTTLSSVEPQLETFIPDSPDDWHNLAVTNIGGDNLVEGFRFYIYFKGDGGNNLFIDNINLNLAPSGLDDPELNNLEMAIAPNPTEDLSTLSFNLLGNREIKYSIIDMTGRSIEQTDLGTLGFGQHSIALDATGRASGVYVVALELDGKVAYTRWSVK